MNGPKLKHVGSGAGIVAYAAMWLLVDLAGLEFSPETWGAVPLAAVIIVGALNGMFGPRQKGK